MTGGTISPSGCMHVHHLEFMEIVSLDDELMIVGGRNYSFLNWKQLEIESRAPRILHESWQSSEKNLANASVSQ